MALEPSQASSAAETSTEVSAPSSYDSYLGQGLAISRPYFDCARCRRSRHFVSTILLRKFEILASMVDQGLFVSPPPTSFEGFGSFKEFMDENLSPENRTLLIDAASAWLVSLKKILSWEADPWDDTHWWKDVKHPTVKGAFAEDIVFFSGTPAMLTIEQGPKPTDNWDCGVTFNLYRGATPQPKVLLGLLLRWPCDWTLGHPAVNHTHGN